MLDSRYALLWRTLLVLALLGSVLVLRRLDPETRWLERLRSRFYLGVPWGSILSLGFVLFVYLVVQEGAVRWTEPLAIPFSAWSYFYPVGWLFASFAHVGPGHLLGNLTSAAILAPLAEYVWGHYPDTKDGAWHADPRLRAFVLFPSFVLGLGVFTSLFTWGPVIGFSGVVFAFAGFVLVRYPLLVVVALAARSALRTVAAALDEPIAVVETTASVSPPWWYGIAVQGHALGFLLGVLVGAALLHHRGTRQDPLRLWLGSLLVGLSLSLWAVWWVRGAETFVLYRALGIALVVALATLVTAALAASDRQFVGTLSYRRTAVLLLVLPLVSMCLVAVPLNLTAVDGASPDEAVTVGDYTVFYDEEITNRTFSVVDVEAFGEATDVTASGVIVVSEERTVWSQEVTRAELRTHGEGSVRVGGLTWGERIEAEREGWVVDDDRVYRIWLEHDGERTVAYTSEPVVVPGSIDGHEVAVLAGNDGFRIAVDGEDRAPVPDLGESVTVEGIEFVREEAAEDENESGGEREDGDVLYAVYGDTAIPIAEEERYTPDQVDR